MYKLTRKKGKSQSARIKEGLKTTEAAHELTERPQGGEWGRGGSFNNFRPGFCYPHGKRTGLGLVEDGKLELKLKMKWKLHAFSGNGENMKNSPNSPGSKQESLKKYLLRTGTLGLQSLDLGFTILIPIKIIP